MGEQIVFQKTKRTLLLYIPAYNDKSASPTSHKIVQNNEILKIVCSSIHPPPFTLLFQVNKAFLVTSDEPEFNYIKSLTHVAVQIPFPILHDDDDINNKNIKLRVHARAELHVWVGAWLPQKF